LTRPVIGITSYLEQAAWGPWDKPAVLVPATYVRAVEKAGGRPLVVPPLPDGLDEVIDALDGLLFIGGSDIDPSMYGATPHPETTRIRPQRDRAEAPLLARALERDVPVLAICRGMELLNVVRGGTMEQHVPDRSTSVSHKVADDAYVKHEVSIKPDSRLGELLGESTWVHSHHHQAPEVIGEGLVEVAWALDDTVEGIEDPSKTFVVGVLWHPEEGDDPAMFNALVDAAGREGDSR
jgi:putative glutamine amidotransferase